MSEVIESGSGFQPRSALPGKRESRLEAAPTPLNRLFDILELTPGHPISDEAAAAIPFICPH